MPQFLIERSLPGASNLSQDEVAAIATKSCETVEGLGVPYTWHHSYVAGDKIYCIHETDDPDTVREHARRGGFPADLVVEIADVIGPSSANT